MENNGTRLKRIVAELHALLQQTPDDSDEWSPELEFTVPAKVYELKSHLDTLDYEHEIGGHA